MQVRDLDDAGSFVEVRNCPEERFTSLVEVVGQLVYGITQGDGDEICQVGRASPHYICFVSPQRVRIQKDHPFQIAQQRVEGQIAPIVVGQPHRINVIPLGVPPATPNV